MQNESATLQKERNYLLSQWSSAKKSDKAKFLVRIMDIDEQLENDRAGLKKNKRAV
ncbi:MAG: hypothetical protein ACYCX4_01960 [Bacillota bacterium]